MSQPRIFGTPVTLCPRCGGTGSVALDQTLHDTLDALCAGTPATSREIHTRLEDLHSYRAGPTAVMNSLKKLMALKLVIRRGKQGRSWLYRLPSESKPTTA